MRATRSKLSGMCDISHSHKGEIVYFTLAAYSLSRESSINLPVPGLSKNTYPVIYQIVPLWLSVVNDVPKYNMLDFGN
jgi:hypothetical protein